MAAPDPAPAKALRAGVLAGIVLLLATPFVVTPSTLFPYVVGKALWSRSIIEIVFAGWAVLALARPEYRPPRSWLLLLLAAGLGVSLLAAVFGVSLQRSLWSSYERMQGVVDVAHWCAFAVVLASVLRTAAEWRALLILNLGASSAMACLVLARYCHLDVPFYGAIPEPHLPRISGPFGNPTFLGLYMLFNLVVALGFAVRSSLPAAAGTAAPAPHPRRRIPAAAVSDRWGSRGLAALCWAPVVALHLCGLVLAGSVAGFVGLFAGTGFLALSCAFLARGRGRWAAIAVVSVLAVSGTFLVLRFVDTDRVESKAIENRAVRYVVNVSLHRPSVQSRLAAWEAGVEGFAARPVLGWGPDNFGAVFGRFASGYAATSEPHDQAHGKLVEVAATTGVLGLAAYLALWSLAFVVVWRAAPGMEARERALVLFVGAALAGGWVQSQALFDTAAGSLQTMLLLGFVAGLEGHAFADARRPRLPGWLAHAPAALFRHGGSRIALGSAAIALAGAGLAVNHAIHTAAGINHVPATPSSLEAAAGGIEGFGPLANTHRWLLFDRLGRHWQELRARDGSRALDLLERANLEAGELVRTEPESWQIHHSLARLYRAVASTDPGYADVAQDYLGRSRELAPNRAVFRRPLPLPGFEVRRLDDGRHELHWRPSAGAAYHQVAQQRGDGLWRVIRYAYDPGRTSLIVSASRDSGPYRYRLRACRRPGDCTAPVERVPIPGPASRPPRP